jgi:hypothetical protein
MKRLLKKLFGRTETEETSEIEQEETASGIDSEWDEEYPQNRPGEKHRSKYRQGGPLRSEKKRNA